MMIFWFTLNESNASIPPARCAVAAVRRGYRDCAVW